MDQWQMKMVLQGRYDESLTVQIESSGRVVAQRHGYTSHTPQRYQLSAQQSAQCQQLVKRCRDHQPAAPSDVRQVSDGTLLQIWLRTAATTHQAQWTGPFEAGLEGELAGFCRSLC